MHFTRSMGAALALLLAAVVASGCGQKKSAAAKSTNAAPSSGSSSGNPLTAPVDYLGAVGNAQKQSIKTLDTIQVQQAIQAFAAGEERLPANLQELISEGYIPRLPDLPRGTRYEYDRTSGRVRIVQAPAPAAGAPTSGAAPRR